jgi:anti-anti-sigma factor
MTPTPEKGHGSSHPAWCSVDEVDGCAVVTAGGDFNVEERYAKLRDALVVASEFSDRIVVDLADIEAIQPTVFGMLLGELHRLRKDSTTIGLIGPPDRVRARLHFTGLEEAFTFYHAVEDALTALQ